MRLKSIWIEDYKNIKNLTVKFSGSTLTEIFVGKNGTGKSNFFEALIRIFQHLFEFGDIETEPLFSYIIEYVIDGKNVKISWNAGKLEINDKPELTLSKTPLPSNVLCYYSGHNNSVIGLLEYYENKFKSRIQHADINDSRPFIGINSDYKELLLSVLLLQPATSHSHSFVCQKLGIEKTGSELKIALKRPGYAIDKPNFDIEEGMGENRFWHAKGITKKFLDSMISCQSPLSEKIVRTEGYQAKEDRYILYIDIPQFLEHNKTLTLGQLFRNFDNLKLLGMLEEISLPITLTNKHDAKISHFSDGQFQSVYIYAIAELFDTENCITLLDEPDSFLHPEWQFDFLTQLSAISDETASQNHILMSSHSAATLVHHDKAKVKYFDLKDSQSICYDLPKKIAINKLSSNLIKYTEQEQLLSIINAIQIENKPVLFTEGSTDPVILKEAWYRIYEKDIPFIPFYAFSCGFLKQLLTDIKIHQEMNGLPVFGLFDFDKAYDQWNDINGEILQDNPEQGLIKKWKSGNSYAFMLPIPPNAEIQKQAIRDNKTKETYKGEACCAIEHLFYGLEKTTGFFKKEPCAGGEKIIFRTTREKTDFAKTVIPSLENEPFLIFKPLFDFILKTIPQQDA